MTNPHNVTILLQGVKNGHEESINQLMPLVYTHLREMANNCLRRERPDHTLDPAGLVHELYLRLIDQNQPDYQNRAHFFAVSSRIMRQILVDHARGRAAAKRGSGMPKLELDEEMIYTDERASLVIAMDDSLKALAKRDEDLSRLVEMKYFGGLTAEESSEVLGIPVPVVRKNLKFAEAWLRRQMNTD